MAGRTRTAISSSLYATRASRASSRCSGRTRKVCGRSFPRPAPFRGCTFHPTRRASRFSIIPGATTTAARPSWPRWTAPDTAVLHRRSAASRASPGMPAPARCGSRRRRAGRRRDPLGRLTARDAPCRASRPSILHAAGGPGRRTASRLLARREPRLAPRAAQGRASPEPLVAGLELDSRRVARRPHDPVPGSGDGRGGIFRPPRGRKRDGGSSRLPRRPAFLADREGGRRPRGPKPDGPARRRRAGRTRSHPHLDLGVRDARRPRVGGHRASPGTTIRLGSRGTLRPPAGRWRPAPRWTSGLPRAACPPSRRRGRASRASRLRTRGGSSSETSLRVRRRRPSLPFRPARSRSHASHGADGARLFSSRRAFDCHDRGRGWPSRRGGGAPAASRIEPLHRGRGLTGCSSRCVLLAHGRPLLFTWAKV